MTNKTAREARIEAQAYQSRAAAHWPHAAWSAAKASMAATHAMEEWHASIDNKEHQRDAAKAAHAAKNAWAEAARAIAAGIEQTPGT